MNVTLTLTGFWQQAAAAYPDLKAAIPGALHKALLQEAEDVRKRMVQQFQKQAPVGGQWAPLSKLTIYARRAQGFKGSKILIRSGDMRNSIAVDDVSQGNVFVGVNRTAVSSSNKGITQYLANLGLIHENGATIKIRVTRKMQRFLFGVLLATKDGRDRAGRFVKKGSKPGGGGGGGSFRVGATIVIRIPARPFVGPAINAKTPAEYEASIAARFAKLMNGKVGK